MFSISYGSVNISSRGEKVYKKFVNILRIAMKLEQLNIIAKDKWPKEIT